MACEVEVCKNLISTEANKLPIVILHVEVAKHEAEHCAQSDGA